VINGSHVIIYSANPDADRAFLRDALGLPHVDAGGGWLIFGLPPSEIAVHPSEGPTWDSGVRHQFSMMCDSLTETVRDLKAKGVEILGEPKEERWGIFVTLNLPGNCHVILYQPKHEVAAGM